MNQLAIAFVSSVYHEHDLSLPFTQMSQKELTSLASEFGINDFQGDLIALIDKFKDKHKNDRDYYVTFASLGSVEWTQKFIDNRIKGSVDAVVAASKRGHLQVITNIVNYVGYDGLLLRFSLIASGCCGGHPNIVKYGVGLLNEQELKLFQSMFGKSFDFQPWIKS